MTILITLWFISFLAFILFHILSITVESDIVDKLLEFGLMEILICAQVLFLLMAFFELMYNFFKLIWII